MLGAFVQVAVDGARVAPGSPLKWLAMATCVAGVVVSAINVVNLVRWPVIDMGGIVARALMLVLLTAQLVPIGGIGMALLFSEPRPRPWRTVYWVWFVTAVVIVLVGLGGAIGFHR